MTGPARVPVLIPAGLVLAVLAALAGCASGPPAGRAAAGSDPGASRPGTARSMPGSPGTGPSISISRDPSQAGSPTAGGSGPQPGCAPWPAGSTRTTLLITPAGHGQRYCVRPGQTVQVYLAGPLSAAAGSEPPRLSGDALVPAPARPGRLLRSSAASYLAVRAGSAVLTIVRLPCHPVRPLPSPGAARTGALGGRRAPGGRAEETAYTGGAPVGAQCLVVQVLRITVVVA